MIQITKKHVDNYNPSKIIPKCQLSADFMPGTGQRDIPMLQYRVKLIGAKEPHNMFVIKPPVSGKECVDHSMQCNFVSNVYNLVVTVAHPIMK